MPTATPAKMASPALLTLYFQPPRSPCMPHYSHLLLPDTGLTLGVPSSTVFRWWWFCSLYICASFSSALLRVTRRPSTSPTQPYCLASIMRSWRLSMTSRSLPIWAGSGRRSAQRRQACSCWQPVPVGAPAAVQAEFALHKVGFEFVPLGSSWFAVFLGGPNDPPFFDERAVIPEDILRVDRSVTLSRRQTGVPHQHLHYMWRQAAGKCLGSEVATEIVRGEPHLGTADLDMCASRQVIEQRGDGGRRHDLWRSGPVAADEQIRKG